jgi:two-component system, sporulation sensor kinase D
MQINYQQKRLWKILLLNLAVMIAIGSLFYTNNLISELAKEERKMINMLADAYKKLNDIQDLGTFEDISFLFEIIKTNENIPIILADTSGNILEYRNLDKKKARNPEYLKKQIRIMESQHKPIIINYGANNKQIIYYKDSFLITQLKMYPYLQLFFVILFILIAYFAFNSSRKFEQNKVWIGMSKETAHQLGTPVSSLMALAESIKESKGPLNENIICELDKDIQRLEIITNRFSKVGSLPVLGIENVHESVCASLNYIKPRISPRIEIVFSPNSNKEAHAWIISPLFDWVIENLCKNSINAMKGEGRIEITVTEKGKYVYVDIKDNGQGIPKSKYKTIFRPGYTTNQRGWGLGLSLSKRIIESYHKGHIFVKNSEINKGTVIRIKLKNA